jgi:hypothetical protein
MTSTPKPPSIFRRLQAPAALNYLVMTAAGLLVYGMVMMGGNEAGVLIAMLLAVAGILGRWHAAPVLILLLTTYLLIDPGAGNLIGQVSGLPWFFPIEAGGFKLEDVVLAAALLAYVIGHFRLTSILHQGMPDEATVRKDRDLLNPPRRPVETVPPDELPRTLVIAGACVVFAEVTWTLIVLIERLGRPGDSEFTPGTGRFILLAWVTGLALMIVFAALVYLRSARMTRQEAALVLRDEFFQENRRETDRLQRWRKWYKERVAARRRSGK